VFKRKHKINNNHILNKMLYGQPRTFTHFPFLFPFLASLSKEVLPLRSVRSPLGGFLLRSNPLAPSVPFIAKQPFPLGSYGKRGRGSYGRRAKGFFEWTLSFPIGERKQEGKSK